MQKNKTTNGFGDALNLDLNPLQTPNTVMTNALNATLVTMNGNELTLQNDMGNGRVETAYLPEGYIPLGSALLGGIIYIVSYNPLLDKSLIGSFPSPERNITSEELGGDDSLSESDFYSNDSYDIDTPYKRLDLTNFELYPGDKYLIYCGNFNNSVINEESREEESSDEGDSKGDNYISAYGETTLFNPRLLPRYIRFSIVSIASNGQIIDMTDSCVWLPLNGYTGYYFMSNLNPSGDGEETDIDDYRSLVTSNYNVFSCKSSGKLGILAQLECIDSFEITWDAIKENGEWQFYFFTNWTYENDIEPDKINLYGLYINGTINNESKDDYITIDLYPVYIYPEVDVSTETEPGPEESTPLAAEPDDGSNPDISIPDTDITLKTTDIMKYQNYISDDEYQFIFCNPSYINSLSEIYDEASEKGLTIEEYLKNYYYYNEKLPRKNNDKDNQFLIGTPYTTNETSGTLKLDITPTMPYGKLSWLTQSFSINLEKLGTGEIDLVEYRYYILDNNITLSWGLDAYPERNKKISKVDFNFYEIDKTVMEWIKEAQYLLDHCKVVDNKWIDCETEVSPTESLYPVLDEEGKINYLTYCGYYYPDDGICNGCIEQSYTEFYNEGYDYSFTVEGKSSYSGHFTNNIIIGDDGSLLNDKVYLLQIKINYAGTDIIYYRIFYTEPIFNSYYYNDDYIDYANIVLEEPLTLQYSTSNESIQTTSNLCIENESDDEVTSIPSYIDKNSVTKSYKYKLYDDYTISELTFNVEGGTEYGDLFKVGIVFTNDELEKPSTFIPNLEKDTATQFNNSGVSSSEHTIDPVKTSVSEYLESYEDNYVKITGATITTMSPLEIEYNKTEFADVQYKMTSIKCLSMFILGTGGKQWMALAINEVASPINTYGFQTSEFYGSNSNADDKACEISPSLTGNIYDTINTTLNDCDVVCLGGALYKGYNKSPSGMYWGKGTLLKQDGNPNNMYTSYHKYNSNINEDLSNSAFILFYAIKSSSDPIFYTYTWDGELDPFGALKNYRYVTDTCGGSADTTLSAFVFSDTNIGTSTVRSAVTDNMTIIEDVVNAPFRYMYKPVVSADTYEVLAYSTIYYYNAFYEDIILDINKEAKVTLSVNDDDVQIPTELNVKNLYYDESRTVSVLYSISRQINNGSVIDSIVGGSDRNFIIYTDSNGDSKVILDSISSNGIYESKEEGKFELLRTLKNASSNTTGFNIRCRNGYLEILDNSVTTKAFAVWGYEEQLISFKNIYVI